jgi:hypothetical protein
MVARMSGDLNSRLVNVDADNFQGAFVDILQKVVPSRIAPIDFEASAKNDRKYFNLLAEMCDELRNWMTAGGKLPNNFM